MTTAVVTPTTFCAALFIGKFQPSHTRLPNLLQTVYPLPADIDRFHLPGSNFILHHCISAIAEQSDSEILRNIFAGGDGALTIVGKYFHEVLVDKHAQGGIFAWLELKRCIHR